MMKKISSWTIIGVLVTGLLALSLHASEIEKDFEGSEVSQSNISEVGVQSCMSSIEETVMAMQVSSEGTSSTSNVSVLGTCNDFGCDGGPHKCYETSENGMCYTYNCEVDDECEDDDEEDDGNG